ncbi:MAG: sigma-70 family RNA polymerase sigma factor, partial [Planctomycetota bacterium]
MSPLERCFDLCARRAWRLAYGMLRDAHEAFDAVQQAFLVAASKSDRVPSDDPWPWFSTVVVHECRNLRRKKKPTPAGSWPGGGEQAMTEAVGPDTSAMKQEEADQLWDAIDGLPDAEREAVVLTHIGGMTHAHAARALGMPRQTLTSAVSRAIDRLRRRLSGPGEGDAVASRLALLPVLDPPGGWSVAFEAWRSGATAATVSTTVASSTVLSSSVGWGGVALMSSKWIGFFGVAVALGLGFWSGHGVGQQADEEASKVAEHRPGDEGRGAAAGEERLAALEAELERERLERQQFQEKFDAERREKQALEQRLAAAQPDGAGKRGPVFTFGQGGQLEAIHDANWPELASASQAVAEGVREIFQLTEAGETPDRDLLIRLQEHIERVRRYEYRTIGKLPTSGRHNGELTHPISLTNLMAEILADAGKPLTDRQVVRIEALGTAFDRDFERLRDSYAGDEVRAKKILDEYQLKGRFVDDLHDLLNPSQRELVVDDTTYRVAGLDLYCPTLLILHTTPVVTGATVDEIESKLIDLLQA